LFSCQPSRLTFYFLIVKVTHTALITSAILFIQKYGQSFRYGLFSFTVEKHIDNAIYYKVKYVVKLFILETYFTITSRGKSQSLFNVPFNICMNVPALGMYGRSKCHGCTAIIGSPFHLEFLSRNFVLNVNEFLCMFACAMFCVYLCTCKFCICLNLL